MSLDAAGSFGRYRLLGEIGRGGEAIVYLADDPVLKRRVALKIFPRAVSMGSAGRPPAFRHEVEVLSRLRHPGICTVHDAGIEDGSAFIAMSYVEGRTLADHSGLGEPESARIGEEAARVVAAAHAASVVHGDLKPANVVVTPEGPCVVLDFGVARLVDEAAQPGSNRLAGTLPYLAPECLVRPPDMRADVYGLGAILFEVIAGRPPHSAPTRAALLNLIQEEDPPLLRSVAPDASTDFEAVLAKALDRDPGRRYATMEDFAADLASLRRGDPTSARRWGPARRAVRWARSRPAAVALVGFAVLFLVVATAVTVAKNLELGRDLERAASEEGRANDALRTAHEHLVRFERLADARLLADLETRAATLVPPTPELVPALRAWLEEAESLERRLDDHRGALAKLRTRGVAPASRPASAVAARARPEGSLVPPGLPSILLAAEIASLRARHALLVAAPDHRSAERELRTAIQALEASLPSVDRWSYASDADAWHDETLAALIADLERFADDDPGRGTMADVRQRIEDARKVEDAVATNERAWLAACQSIADRSACPRYEGLAIRPQLGLVPLRRDRGSGLWEFLHVLSGAAPRESADGRLEPGPDSGIVLVLIPGGVTRLGAKRPGPADSREGAHLDPLADLDESPPLEVAIDPFFLSKFEMTHQQWERVGGRGSIRRLRAGFERVHVPVSGMSWIEATRAVARAGLELPTEAQWEHGARAGTFTPWWTGSDPASLSGAAIFSSESPEPIGGRKPNGFGLHDVAGNVSEWCRDTYAMSRSYAPGTGAYPPGNLDLRVYRGGGFRDDAKGVRSSARARSVPTQSVGWNGIRPARRVDR